MSFVFRREWICPQDKKSLSRYEQYVPYYALKHDIAKEFNPRRILEIGVRAGYSAVAFLTACPEARYIGLDADNGKHGGEGGPWTWWAEHLLQFYPKASIRIQDTRELSELPDGPHDFIHVDGDHTFSGALADLELALHALDPRGVILVDDYTYLPDVRHAVDRFLSSHPELVSEHRASLRGEVLIRFPQTGG